MLSKENTKLGRIHNFSLPARTTCPGMSAWCSKHCYACKGHFTFSTVADKHQENYLLSHTASFVPLMQNELQRNKVNLLRWHVSGDFYNRAYSTKWLTLAQNNPATVFFGYTKSWQVPEIRAELEKLRRLPNVRLFASTDATMPPPPQGWRQAGIDFVADPQFHLCHGQCSECGNCFSEEAQSVILRVH